MENGRCRSGHSSLTGCPEAYARAPLRMFWGALRMTSVGMWLRLLWFCVAASCEAVEGAPVAVDFLLGMNVVASLASIWRYDRERLKRIADYLEKY